jgi:hypothetical protein
MTCLHAFEPHPVMAVLFCSRCGESKSLEQKRVPDEGPAARRKFTSRKNAQPQQATLPFGEPIAINEGGRSMFDSPEPPGPADMATLERAFFGKDAISQAAILEELASARRGGRPVPQGDPPNTYRPGTGETLGRAAGADGT